ncbi:YugN-like family protein [Bacillus sp. FJAT-29790]|uniref:YugN family protein n=1 Tax=Bacillus sp. FJAT-29790 TaxID=1895002 RepID=UPI001C223850|nr:YugN family protein [Bacillus sp. FJAT-29790]MBU8878992.1 YugN-like family protein [Bacillus sp. FJAT-29790]
MIKLNSVIKGKRAHFGIVRKMFLSHGCSFCSNFEYDQGKFDAVLWREGGETIYLRIPFNVLDGALDHSNAYIEFGTPYVIKHVVNTGLDYDENSLLTATTGLSQFQEPLDKDGFIRDKSRWEKAGEETVEQVLNSMNNLLSS